MSSAPDAHAVHASHSTGSHDPHDHAFDGEPSTELAADEPRTPGWVPAVGTALFAILGVAFLATRDPAGPLPKPPEAPVQIEPIAAPEARPAEARPAAQRPTGPAPARTGPVRELTDDQKAQLQKRIQAARARGQLPGGPSGSPRAPAPPAAAPH